MKDFEKYYNDDVVLELVLMNEDLCFHRAAYPHPQGEWKGSRNMVDSFAKPQWSFSPASEDAPLKADVWCPICSHTYDEAAARLKADLEAKYLSEKGGKDEV